MKKSFAEHYKNIMNQHDRNMNTILLDSITIDKNINNNIPKRGQKRRYIQISESDSEEQETKDETREKTK
jgi:small nuclear ribonucleoprotein (snRNP)-like protein